MAVITRILDVQAQGDNDIIDLTEPIEKELGQCAVRSGTVTVFVKHTTAAVTIIETEPGLLHDYRRFWDQVAPREMLYEHHRGGDEDNGHSHVRASTLGPSLVVPFVEGRMTLGAWQHIILIDFDTQPRSRQVVLQIMGE